MTIDLQDMRAMSAKDSSPNERIATLERIVVDLMMEIEALRAAVLVLSERAGLQPVSDHVLDPSPAGVAGPHTVYGRAYLETAVLTHDATGPTSGKDKLLELFYGSPRSDGMDKVHDCRELNMLIRLGYDDSQKADYVASASAAETRT